MVFVITIICWIIAILALLQSRFIFHPVGLMFFIWGILIPISASGAYGVHVPSDRSFSIMEVGLAGYLIGALIGSHKTNFRIVLGRNKAADTRECIGYNIRYNLLYVLNWISIVFFIFQAVIVVSLLRSGYDYSYIRELATTEDYNVLRQSRVLSNVRVFIATPVTYLEIAILPIEIFYGRKDKKLICQIIAMIFLWVFTSGGRSIIIWEVLYFVCVLLIQKKKINKIEWRALFNKYKYPFIIGGICLLLFLYFITISRKGEDVDFLKQFYIYYVAPLSFFDYHINALDSSTSKYLVGYGVSSFYGFFYPILFVYKLVAGSYPDFIESIYYRSFGILEHGVDIGGGIWMNAFATFFYQPYLDGRFIGTFIILMLFGYLCMRIYRKAKDGSDPKYMLIYLLLLQKISDSMVRFYFTQQVQAIAFILAFVVIVKVYRQDSYAY